MPLDISVGVVYVYTSRKEKMRMISVTSAQANKMLNKLNDEITALYQKEQQSSRFNAAVGENISDARPEYSFENTRTDIAILENKVRKIKHAINLFNTRTEVPGTGKTIDEVLVHIPQITKQKKRLADMKSNLPKERVQSSIRTGNLIEYTYANYDIQDASKAYDNISDELSAIQNALDTVNNTVYFSIDLDN